MNTAFAEKADKDNHHDALELKIFIVDYWDKYQQRGQDHQKGNLSSQQFLFSLQGLLQMYGR